MFRRMFPIAALLAVSATLVFTAGTEAQNKAKPPSSVPAEDAAPAAGTTLENLQAAHTGESNAHARYIEFAKKAESEGYAPIASLFRAAARAEEIHAQNHAEVIKKLGGTPNAEIKKTEIKSTKENLVAAMEGENYERLEMYPGFIAKARKDKQPDAIRTFNFAQLAETEHAKLFKQVHDEMALWKGAPREFYVCTVCGYTTMKLDFEKCLACFSPKEKYETVK